MSTNDPAHVARIEEALKGVLETKQGDSAEARHRSHYQCVARSTPRLRCLARIVARRFDRRPAARERPDHAPSCEELGLWIFGNWGDLREAAIIAATCGDES